MGFLGNTPIFDETLQKENGKIFDTPLDVFGKWSKKF